MMAPAFRRQRVDATQRQLADNVTADCDNQFELIVLLSEMWQLHNR